MRKKRLLSHIILFLFLGFCVSLVEAQNISVIEEPAITEMVKKHKSINFNENKITGWRIQILATSDRLKMERVKGQFQNDFPNIPVSWTHEKPYYKLRAGAFFEKIDAVRLLYQLKSFYPGAYTTKDINIRPIEFVRVN